MNVNDRGTVGQLRLEPGFCPVQLPPGHFTAAASRGCSTVRCGDRCAVSLGIGIGISFVLEDVRQDFEPG